MNVVSWCQAPQCISIYIWPVQRVRFETKLDRGSFGQYIIGWEIAEVLVNVVNGASHFKVCYALLCTHETCELHIWGSLTHSLEHPTYIPAMFRPDEYSWLCIVEASKPS
jgi:hypothetical protein